MGPMQKATVYQGVFCSHLDTVVRIMNYRPFESMEDLLQVARCSRWWVGDFCVYRKQGPTTRKVKYQERLRFLGWDFP